MDFEYKCWRDKFEKYRKRLKEIQTLEKEIAKLQKKRESAPVVKDKVRSSMDEFPYIETHITVDALDPLHTQNIDRMIWKRRRLIEAYNAEIMEVDNYILNIPDFQTREAFRLVYIEGMTHKKAAEEMHFSRSRVTRLINDEFNRKCNPQ